MTHGEFIERFNHWEPLFKAHKSGTPTKDIANKEDVMPMMAGNMFKFVERNLSTPRCQWLSDFSNDSVKKLCSLIDLSSVEKSRKQLIDRFRIDPSGPYKSYPKFINTGVLRRVLQRSGLRWYERDGKPCIHWKETA